jgi:hypothetical protein
MSKTIVLRADFLSLLFEKLLACKGVEGCEAELRGYEILEFIEGKDIELQEMYEIFKTLANRRTDLGFRHTVAYLEGSR